jgi:hypothetical protein
MTALHRKSHATQYMQVSLFAEKVLGAIPDWGSGSELFVAGPYGLNVSTADADIEIIATESVQDIRDGFHQLGTAEVSIGADGVTVGNGVTGDLTTFQIASGKYSVSIHVDSVAPHAAKQVAFLIHRLGEAAPLPQIVPAYLLVPDVGNVFEGSFLAAHYFQSGPFEVQNGQDGEFIKAFARGLEVSLNKERKIRAIFLYGLGDPEFDKFAEPLPSGLTFETSRLATQGRLGTPGASGEVGGVGLMALEFAWDRYNFLEFYLHLEYARGDVSIRKITLGMQDA